MNLNEFKLLKEDETHYHIEHPSGKKLSVSKGLLSPSAKSAIQKMCSGGQVKGYDEGGIVDSMKSWYHDQATKGTFGEGVQATALADDRVKGGAERTKAAYKQMPQNQTTSNEYAKGGMVQYFSKGGMSVLDDPSLPPPDIPVVSDAPVDRPPAAELMSSAPPIARRVEANVAPPPVAGPAVDPLVGRGLGMEDLLSKEQKDIADLSGAQVGEAQANAKALGGYNAQRAQKAIDFEDQMQAFKDQDKTLMQAYLSKEVDPNKFVHDMGTGSKIKAGIAMVLGGLGAGLGGGENKGIEWFNNVINRDIEKQKSAKGNAYNAWRMNRDAMGDDMRAHVLTQNQMWTGVQAKLAQNAAEAQAPIAKFRAQQMINEIEKQKVQNRMTMGLMTQSQEGPSGSFSTTNPALLVPRLVPEAHQKQAFAEIEAAQNTARNAPDILKAFDEAANNVHAVDFVPGMQNKGQMAMHALLGPTFQDVEGTVRQAAMDNLFANVTPAFGDNKSTSQSRRESLLHYLTSKSSAPTTRGYGIDLSKFKSTSANPLATMSGEQQQIYNWAKANPDKPKAQEALDKFRAMGVK